MTVTEREGEIVFPCRNKNADAALWSAVDAAQLAGADQSVGIGRLCERVVINNSAALSAYYLFKKKARFGEGLHLSPETIAKQYGNTQRLNHHRNVLFHKACIGAEGIIPLPEMVVLKAAANRARAVLPDVQADTQTVPLASLTGILVHSGIIQTQPGFINGNILTIYRQVTAV